MINKLILGTVQLGLDYGINNQLGKPSLDKAFDILNEAFDNGIKILDTAEAYGDSQGVIGKFHKTFPNKLFQIITKLEANSNIHPEDFLNHIKQNCKTLGVDKLYGYMYHNYKSLKGSPLLYNEIINAKKHQIIERVGISLYANDEIEDVLTNYSGFDFIQTPFNLLDNASKRQQILEKAKAKNIEIHIRSVFLQGIFFKTAKTLPQKLKPLKPYLEILESIKEKYNLNTESLALQYVLEKEYINRVLIGVETPEQLANNIINSSKKNNIPHTAIDNIDVKEIELLNPSNWS